MLLMNEDLYIEFNGKTMSRRNVDMDKVRQKHGMLSINIGKMLKKSDIRSLKQVMKGFGEGELEKMKDFFDIYSALERQCQVKIGEYKYLEDLLISVGAQSAADEVVALENEIRGMMGRPTRQRTKEQTVTVNAVPPAEPMMVDEERFRASVQVMADANPTHEDCPSGLKYPFEFRTGGSNGLLVIIDEFTHHRRGSTEDVKRLITLFTETFGFKVEYYENRLKQEIIDIYKAKAQELRSGHIQRFFSVILSHGDEDGILTCGPPGQVCNREYKARLKVGKDIQPLFSSCVLPAMAGRPKVFFVQACRGVAFQEGQEVADDANMGDDNNDVETDAGLDYPIAFVPDDADVLMSYAQTIGYKAFRDKKRGSWYIQAICEVFEEYHEKYDVLTMMTMVGDNVSSMYKIDEGKICKQMPCQHSTLRKRIYMTR